MFLSPWMKTKINEHRKSLEYFKIDVLNKIVRVAAVVLEVTLYLAYTIILYYKQNHVYLSATRNI